MFPSYQVLLHKDENKGSMVRSNPISAQLAEGQTSRAHWRPGLLHAPGCS